MGSIPYISDPLKGDADNELQHQGFLPNFACAYCDMLQVSMRPSLSFCTCPPLPGSKAASCMAAHGAEIAWSGPSTSIRDQIMRSLIQIHPSSRSSMAKAKSVQIVPEEAYHLQHGPTRPTSTCLQGCAGLRGARVDYAAGSNPERRQAAASVGCLSVCSAHVRMFAVSRSLSCLPTAHFTVLLARPNGVRNKKRTQPPRDE